MVLIYLKIFSNLDYFLLKKVPYGHLLIITNYWLNLLKMSVILIETALKIFKFLLLY
jgi:hypothetical protein